MRGNDLNNPHCHLIVRDRHFETGKRSIQLSEKGSTERAREIWETCLNTALKKVGFDETVDRRSLKAQRNELLEKAADDESMGFVYSAKSHRDAAEVLNRKPQGHEGPKAREISRSGRVSHKLDRIRLARAKRPEPRTEPNTAQPHPDHPKGTQMSLRGFFEAALTPETWHEGFFRKLKDWGLIQKRRTAEELADELTRDATVDAVLMKFRSRPNSARIDILDDFGLPREMTDGKPAQVIYTPAADLDELTPPSRNSDPLPVQEAAPASSEIPKAEPPDPKTQPSNSWRSGPSGP